MSVAYALADSRVMVTRSLRHTVRNVDVMLTAVMLPVVLMLMFVYVFGGAMDTGTSEYVNYVVPGIILLCAGFGAGSTALSVAGDMEQGIIARFKSMPITSSAVVMGHVVASVVRNLVATALVIGVAFAVGWRPDATLVEWVAALGLVVLFILAISWLSAAFGLLLKTVEAANAFTFVLLFLPYVSSAFVPTNSMPSALQGFAAHQPVTPVIETLRGLWMGTPIDTNAWLAIAWCGGILVLSYAWAIWLFRNRTSS
ncbi:ABC transporter permease [Solicola gregarius]|uniref:Transport permease protein n=1 Tax=Solicola gregarius TaxID=2908642 RepID=A0AA46YNQ4_9ACTN|nr:ABC transporter permease [Solicola gregarius]UYM07721.1 ABC transporter permease [Solicola gregarius]